MGCTGSRKQTWISLRELTVKGTCVGPRGLYCSPKLNLNQENVLGMQEGVVVWRWGGDRVNQEDVFESTCTRAKNEVRSYHGCRSAQHSLPEVTCVPWLGSS